MPTAKVNGIDLYYGDYGQGTPIVFAHGVGGNHASWFHQIAFFSRWYRVIAIDHRGFGNSHDPPEGPGAAAFVDDLAELLDTLGIRETVLVAQSMGGATCLGYALRYPERTLALVMADTGGGISAPGPLQERLEEQRRLTDNLSQADRVVSKRFQQAEPALTQLYLEIASFNDTNRRNMRGRALFTPAPAELARLTMPKLFLVGQDDILVPPDIMKMVSDIVPDAKLTMIPDAGHSAYFEKPDAFNQVLLAFLSESGFGPDAEARTEPASARS
ncbi:MAG TPA: alpha/beta hydrolase [Dehalococcoidia bacterium]|nr:alpha/beta hydrolase [Dehalococcoidia bacterium]